MPFKGTPGPWTLGEREDDGQWGAQKVLITGESWNGLASVYVRVDDQDSDDEIGTANANLIAAAPTMLEALELCVKHWGPRDCFLLHEEKLALEEARIAIAKARGEVPE